ncbi:interleukin-31 receptor subunit alpha isoform X2 [Hyla sarda]|uniref:interleukin-31 receptor subunit alpha isoform X2 n=1 Tax=Hyla sarda TaxID=327740 RepID=UPI0024C43DD4|nr:interleukin-31 receptor subunit alpha isoform X2 [Hyla sarda]
MEKVSSWMMFCCLPWILLLAAAPITGAGSIFPRVKFVLRGSNVTFYCRLNTAGLIQNVHWSFGTDVALQPVYDIVNDTVSKVTLPNLTAVTMSVTCSIRTPSLQHLDKIHLTTGYLPEMPENVSCIYFHKRNVTCSWNPGNDPQIPTTFHLTVLNDGGKKCSTAANSCSFPVGREDFGREYIAQLLVENALGSAARRFTVNTAKIVKMDPPEILFLKPLPVKDPAFLMSWRRPTLAPDELNVKCSLRYRQLQQDGQWDYTHDLNMWKDKEMSYNLSGLHAYTEYAVSLRCIGSSGQIWWSEWSAELTGRTAEQAPTHSVELWRVIDSTEKKRLLFLMWKERSGIRPAGITQGYDVQWFSEDESFDSGNITTTNREMMLHISEEAYIVSVVYFNSAGRSPKAVLRIPATREKAREVISTVQVAAAEGESAILTWTVTDLRYRRFVLDWYLDSGVGFCNISFQYVENSSTWTIEKGTLEPYKRYKISVYPILENSTEAPATTYFYIREKAPLCGPTAKVVELKKTEVTIRWNPLRPNETNGFITAYSIFYTPVHGSESVVTVNSDVYECSLRSLMPNTLYSAYVVAFNRAGNGSGDHIQFHTLSDSSEYIGALAGTLGTCLLLLLVLGITYKYKKEKIKNLLWPKVPDPSYSSICDWPSDWLQTLQLLDPVWTDGALHSGNLQILHAVYVNDRRDRELLLLDSWSSTQDKVSLDESSIVMHYAATEKQPEPCLLLLDSAAETCSYSRTAAESSTPLDLVYREDSATFNPYLKNSVQTREMLHMTHEGTNR